jgi:hypothetical protein
MDQHDPRVIVVSRDIGDRLAELAGLDWAGMEGMRAAGTEGYLEGVQIGLMERYGADEGQRVYRGTHWT